MRKINDISPIQPLQITTVQLRKNASLPGIINAPVNVIGSALAAKVTLSRNANVKMPSGIYRIEVVAVGAVGVGSYKVTDIDHGVTSATTLSNAAKVAGIVAGVDIVVTDTTGTTIGDYVEFEVLGDQTFIIPGTVLGRIASGVNKGRWEPSTDALASSHDAFLIAQTFQETDKGQTVRPNGYEFNVSEVYTIDAIAFGCVYESVCTGINLTATLKGKITGIVWL